MKQIPVEALGEKKVLAFVAVLRERLLEKDRVFSKKYLKLLAEEIRYQNRQLVMKGSYAAVARVAGERKVGTPQGTVPTFGLDWLPGQGSNNSPGVSKPRRNCLAKMYRSVFPSLRGGRHPASQVDQLRD